MRLRYSFFRFLLHNFLSLLYFLAGITARDVVADEGVMISRNATVIRSHLGKYPPEKAIEYLMDINRVIHEEKL